MSDSLSVDPTLQPALTIRRDDRLGADAAPEARWLPSLSVDLREATGTTERTSDRTDLEVRGLIGEGGMGRVLLARQHSLERDVAVKTARRDASASSREAILQEGAITGQLEHPAIVPVHALGLDSSGWPAMVMKRIEGVAWDALVADAAHPGWEGWEGTPADRLPGHLEILSSVCNALHFAHSRGVVHRDIKPANVLIGRFGDVYVADWGVAARIDGQPTELCGTPAFMAPEMVTGAPVDARTDVYLLGATLHVVLTGKPRHQGATVTEVLLLARTSTPHAYGKDVPEELATLANRACHVDPAQRPQSAKAFRDQLSVYLRHRDARALTAQAIKRVAEVEALHALPAPNDEQRLRLERSLLEASFGLEQALAQWAENAPARAALGRVEAILEQRRLRALELEREAKERDPLTGAAWRSVGLSMMTVLALAAAISASLEPSAPTPTQMVLYPALILAVTLVGTLLLRRQMLQTRFNRHVFACLLASMGLMVFGRLMGLFVAIAPPEHFVRDSYMTAGVMAVCAVALLRWTAIISVLFVITGALCQAFPGASLALFSWATVACMSSSAIVAWWVQRSLPLPQGGRGSGRG